MSTPYFKHLDQWRFIAFFWVFLYHVFLYFKPVFLSADEQWYFYVLQYVMTMVNESGDIGVNFFFTLSGFLITYLLLFEQEQHQNISIFKFYVRRILRIWPLYFTTILLGYFMLPNVFPNIYYKGQENIISFALFLANWDIFWNGYPSKVLGVHWSVAIEEQFYLMWPLLLAFLPKRAFPWLCLMLIAVSFYYNITSEHIHRKFHSLMALNYLSWGALLAYIKYTYPAILKKFEHYKPGLWVFFGISILVIYTYKLLFHQMGVHYYSYRPFIALYLALFYVSIIAYASEKSTEANPVFSYLGQISYGLYLWHMFFIVLFAYFLRDLNWNIWLAFTVKFTLSLVCSIGFAALSYRLLEKPFLKWKKTYSTS